MICILEHIKLLRQALQPTRMASADNSMKFWPSPNAGQLPSLTDFAKQQLALCKEIKKPFTKADAVDLDKFMEISEDFPAEFGTDSCRVKTQPEMRWDRIKEQIASAYPIVHELALLLYINFLEHKQKFGNSKELSVYKDATLPGLVDRLLRKRCVYFVGSCDTYMLLDGTRGADGFELVGTINERAPLLLENVLSYDEIKLSALLYASTHSEFINNGERSNRGRVEGCKSNIEIEGVIMGLIGARFERRNVMEWQDILITPDQNIPERGYGAVDDSESLTREQDYRRIWREFYQEPKDFCYNDPLDDKIFGYNKEKRFKFDEDVMAKRYAISFDTLLLEAEARAAEAGKPAYIHVVGIGLGVWKYWGTQEQIFIATFEQRLRALSERLKHIGIVHFSWFKLDKWGGMYDGACIEDPSHPQGGIRVRISVRNPADKLTEDMLLIVTYAWDGNALPGNEFWAQMLHATGDPAAACSTLIAELQNPHINRNYMSVNNLHIASIEHGVLHVADYAAKVLESSGN